MSKCMYLACVVYFSYDKMTNGDFEQNDEFYNFYFYMFVL